MNQDQQKETDIQSLLSAPFVAAAKASSEMAKKQASFLIENSFDVEGDKYKPKMITMAITKNVLVEGEMKSIVSHFELPLLTLLPVNTLAVTDINLKFDLEILTAINHSNDDGDKHVTLHGGLTYHAKNENSKPAGKNAFNSNSKANLSVEMNGGTVPLPMGFTTILDLYTKNISLSGTGTASSADSNTASSSTTEREKPTENE
ncbi:DUF2589 domain-containing protein [Neptunitalea lumnitzerae]|uniref:DUF2589 domain-containing protein n=1 Tax=Neptunitalea lumnitzerae TaxID=2965509 RepID=A0ABQ5MGY3_9FLAO|nr:DUF2589 domain-containing protein [Neptunitalea sp. Y10]GLB48566.1 hypothetical protein Y10_09340 [Neptunitalea sp. Y10]